MNVIMNAIGNLLWRSQNKRLWSMLNVHRTVELNKHLAVWLCCLPDSPLVDCYKCQHCANHGVAVSGSLERMQQAYLGLLPDQRTVIYLKVVLGFSNRDVAEILSRSIGAVKAIQHRALITLSHSSFSEYPPIAA